MNQPAPSVTNGSSVHVLRGGTVFGPDGSFETNHVVLDGDRITSIGGMVPREAIEIDCSGSSILPGFIDCHVHVMTTTLDVLKSLDTRLSYRFYQAARNLEATLHAGVTTVRDAAGADAGIKRAIADGVIQGPRLLTAIGMISQTGGHGDRTMPCGVHLPSMPEYPGMPNVIADGPDEMRRVVRTLIREGADVIKVATSGGVMSPRNNTHHAHLRPAELDVMIEEAAAAGLPTMAHAHSAAGVKSAVLAGIDSIEHAAFLDEEGIDLMRQKGTFLVPTLVSGPGVLKMDGLISEESIRKVKLGIASHMDAISAAVAAGVRIAMGTDSGVTPHGLNLDELALMGDAGMSPTEVLFSATREAAVLLGIGDDVGTIEPGKGADLVVINGDPLDLAAIPDSISMVISRGRVVRDAR